MTDYAPLVARASAGDREALSAIIEAVRDRIFGLALRMLSNPTDAEDATQEILLQIITHLGTYRAESSFLTWAYRVATNHLLNTRKRSADEKSRTFAAFGAQIDGAVEAAASFKAVQTDEILEAEIRMSCTHSMLVCLTREERIAFIVGAIFEVSGAEGAELLGITPATFRKRLSRARTRLEEFMRARCGIYDGKNACRCKTVGQVAIGTKSLSPERFRYVRLDVIRDALATDEAREFENLLDAAQVLKTQPEYATPKGTLVTLERILDQTTAGDPSPRGN